MGDGFPMGVPVGIGRSVGSSDFAFLAYGYCPPSGPSCGIVLAAMLSSSENPVMLPYNKEDNSTR